MRILFTIFAAVTFTFLLSFTRKTSSYHNRLSYQELADTIEKYIEQNGSFSSCGDKITGTEISANGDIQLFCAKKEMVSLNIYELFKTYKTRYGIELSGQNTIRFDFAGGKTFTLSFASSQHANEVFGLLVSLINSGKDQYLPDLPLDINETVDSINNLLRTLCDYNPQIRVNITGTMIITNNNMQFFHFNISDLVSNAWEDGEGFEVNGIEMIPCTIGKVAANNWINFNTAKGRAAFIKFYQADDAEVAKLHQLFIYLRASLMNVMYS